MSSDLSREYDSITPFLPTKGWLGNYLHFTQNLEICPRFRFFSACCVLGAAINNKVWLQRGDEGLLPRLMPNLWVSLLAPPYKGHKTSCINMAVNMLMQAFPEVRLLADKLTPEAVVHALAAPQNEKETIRIGPRDATGLIKAPEMSVIFGKQQYNIGMVSLITDLYDYREEWRSETIGRGKEMLYNNCISVFTGSTPSWFQRMLPQDAFSGGFMRRFVLVEMPSVYYKRDAFPKKPDNSSWEALVKQFQSFAQFKGQIGFTSSAKKFYSSYYNGFTSTGDEQFDSYQEGATEQVLKLGMLLDMNEGRFEVTEDSLSRSKHILQAILPETILRIKALTTHPRMQTVQDVKELLMLHGELSEAELLAKLYRGLAQGERQLYEALSILKKTGVITPIGKIGNYSYRLTKEKKGETK